MYFVLLAFEKITGFDKKIKNKLIRRLYILFFVQMGWVVFRAANLGQAVAYIKTMLNMGAEIPMIDYYAIRYFGEHRTFFLFAFICSVPVGKWIAKVLKNRSTAIVQIGYAMVYMVLFFLAVSYIVKGTYNPFIYFNF